MRLPWRWTVSTDSMKVVPVSENDDYLAPWASDMLRAGAVDNRGRPSDRALAKIAGASNATVSRMLRGITEPQATTVDKVASALEIDPSEVWRRLGVAREQSAAYAPPEESAFLTQRERKLVTEMIRVLVEGRHEQPNARPRPYRPNGALQDRSQSDVATSGVPLSEMPIDPSLPQSGKHSWTPDMPTAELLPLVFDLVDEREHADLKPLREQAARQLDELLRHLAERRTTPGSTDTDIGQKVQDLDGSSTSSGPYPWESDDFDLAAKRGRNRGREARDQQDRDAEDGGA